MQRLVGVGVGPGDPELVTVKGVRVLREADIVLVPVVETGETGRAESTVRHHLDDEERVRRVIFALGDKSGGVPSRRASWQRAAEAVRDAFDEGATLVAFATIGDPNVYSTFTPLARTVRQLVPGIAIETVPGITAMQDLAARSGVVVVEGSEPLVLLPVTGVDEVELAEAMGLNGTVVAYKCGSRMPEVLEALRDSDRLEDGVYGAALGLPGEDIRKASELDPDAPAPYLSTIIAPRVRPGGGGRL
jgi:precorrin-2/cobalt-factor-2 C20-methyltransferase